MGNFLKEDDDAHTQWPKPSGKVALFFFMYSVDIVNQWCLEMGGDDPQNNEPS